MRIFLWVVVALYFKTPQCPNDYDRTRVNGCKSSMFSSETLIERQQIVRARLKECQLNQGYEADIDEV